jgi:hypothetical protein
MEYSNSVNGAALKREKAVYQRLGNHEGIIHCFKASDDGIELVFAKEGDLEAYIKENIDTLWVPTGREVGPSSPPTGPPRPPTPGFIPRVSKSSPKGPDPAKVATLQRASIVESLQDVH